MSDLAKLPALITSRRIKSAELTRPMLGVRMIGDPRYDKAEFDDIADLETRRAVQYAAAMVLKSRAIEDFEGIDALYQPPATVIFIRADSSQAEIARFVVPDRVMNFDPERPALPAPEGAS